MRKMIGFVIILSLWLCQIAAAATIPDKHGSVQDTAGMFSQSEQAAVEAAAKGNTYQFYVLTVESLDGADAVQFATQVYRSWGLQTNDVLLLIAKQERRIEMNFKNADLQNLLNGRPGGSGTGSAAIRGFVDEYFIPLAKEGKFADASVALITQTEQLKSSAVEAAIPSAVPTAAPTTAPAAVADTPSPVQPPVEPNPAAAASPREGQTGTAVVVPTTSGAGYGGLVVLLVAALGALLIVAWMKLRRIKKLHKQLGAIMTEINQASEQLRPFLGLVQGKTEQVVNDVDGDITTWMVRLNEKATELANTRIFWLHYKKLNQVYERYLAEKDAAVEAAVRIKEEVSRIATADRNSKQLIEKLRGDLQQHGPDVEAALKETGFPLTAVIQEAEALQAMQQQAENLQLFDPIEAERIALQAADLLTAASEGVRSIPRYKEKYLTFPAAAADHREQINQLVRAHRIEKAVLRLNPFALIDNASSLIESMYVELRAGQMRQVAKLGQEADNLLEQALATTNRQVQLRVQNQEDVLRTQERLNGYKQDIRYVNDELSRVRDTYAEHHWQALEAGWQQALIAIGDADTELPHIRQQTSDDVQEFELARRALDEWSHKLNDADRTVQQCRHTFRQLDERLELARRELRNYGDLLQQTVSLIRSESLTVYPEWERTKRTVNETGGSLNGLLARPRYDLDVIEDALMSYTNNITSFNDAVKRTIQEKRAAEQRFREAASHFQSAHARVGSRIHRGGYSSSYSSVTQEAESLMARGMYAEAITRMAVVSEIVREMENDYQRVLEAEREEAERRRQEDQQRMQQSQSSGGSSWDSGSSSGTGSSGSDSSNNSSGGSNW